MPEISWILVGAVMLANERLEPVVIKGIYTTYVYILKYMRMSFSQLLWAMANGQIVIRQMKGLLILVLMLVTTCSFGQGQTDSLKVDKDKLNSLIEAIKKDKKKFDTFEKDFSENKLSFKPIIDKTGLTSIEVRQEERLLYIFDIDPKTYKITGEYDWR